MTRKIYRHCYQIGLFISLFALFVLFIFFTLENLKFERRRKDLKTQKGQYDSEFWIFSKKFKSSKEYYQKENENLIVENEEKEEEEIKKEGEDYEEDSKENNNFNIKMIQDYSDEGEMEKVLLEDMLNILKNKIDLNKYGKTKIYFIVTTWRSGSTFIGEALSVHPAVFYHYEPLTRFEFKDLTNGPLLEEALEDLNNLMYCKYKKLERGYMNYARNDTSIFGLNSKLKFDCDLYDFCNFPEFPSMACKIYPVQVFKIVRLRLEAFERFLENSNYEVHVITLMRDPRAIMLSRKNVTWCDNSELCSDVNYLCHSMKEDIYSYKLLKEKYPDRVHLVKYETIANDPFKSFPILLNEIGLEWDPSIKDYLLDHSLKNEDNPWSTSRVSKSRIDRWKGQLSKSKIFYIEKNCKWIMNYLNYTFTTI